MGGGSTVARVVPFLPGALPPSPFQTAHLTEISHGYMRDDKQTTVVLSQPGTPAGGTPVSFALSTPTFKLGTPLIPPTPAKALMGVSTGTPVVENQGQKK